jgi:hypothetical protein
MENRTQNNIAEDALEHGNDQSKFAHIKGWGVDADPENDPTYPMKQWNGDDHKRSHYHKPKQQAQTVEILKTVERKDLSAVFGTSVPPSGLSGMIRRYAFKYGEDSYRHWLPLILADRVNVVEGIIDDLKHGHIPNIFAEKGWNAGWKYNRKGMITKLAVTAGVLIGVAAFLYGSSKRKSSFR